MKKITGSEVRNLFLTFFQEKGHQILESKSLIPHEDKTLLWINSGVATMKKYFDGTITPTNPRMTNSQKSIRTNDIENVGITSRHHTLFEMLGNFSIGDYFKEEAIKFAWEFLTSKKWLALDKERLYVTVYPEDKQAYDCWKNEIGLSENHIIKLEGNFWEIGQGPSGPCSEIFYDRGEKYNLDTPKSEMYPGGENERYIEIWNLVFSQFNADPEKKRSEYEELPNKNIDTGMGLERLVSIIQGAETNYETDLFMPIIQAIETKSGIKYDGASINHLQAFRVIADHTRAVTLAIADGALPSNEGRGYIIRRLIRRAVKFSRELNFENAFMYELVKNVVEILGEYFTNIKEKALFISDIIKKEEERFLETLTDGLKIFNEIAKKAKESSQISGRDAFKLYDTYGFPFELTVEYAKELKLTVDETEFKIALEEQRERARSARQNNESMQMQNETFKNLDVKSQYVGEECESVNATVLTIMNDNGNVKSLMTGEKGYIILDETPFYAEGGGQCSDTGEIIEVDGETKIKVIDIKKAPNGQHLHLVEVIKGKLVEKQKVIAKVNVNKKAKIRANHTATHLLHKALQDVLGSHVTQAGSNVTENGLRFDFSHFSAMSNDEIDKVEKLVNEKIFSHLSVDIKEMSLDEAKVQGAMALFDDKYTSNVRTVRIGDYSFELCGGSHVQNTMEIGMFKILKESGIAAGSRRIEAVTNEVAYKELLNYKNRLDELAVKLKVNNLQVEDKVSSILTQLEDLIKVNQSLNAKIANQSLTKLDEKIEKVNNINILLAKVAGIENSNLRNIIDQLKVKHKSIAVILANVIDEKIVFVSGVTDDLVKQGIKAGGLVKTVATICGGNGGGRPDFAQAGGRDENKIEEAFEKIKAEIKNLK